MTHSGTMGPVQAGFGEYPERASYNRLYASNRGAGDDADLNALRRDFVRTDLTPFKSGGATKGLARGLALRKMLADLELRRQDAATVRVLDAGCGRGSLSLFLASLGFDVVAVDLSDVAIGLLNERAARCGLADRISAHAASLEDIPVDDGGVDLIIGFAALHHFIKYSKVSGELERVLAPAGRAYFADSFGENRLYQVFHDRERMRELGDVILTRQRIHEFFGPGLDITLYPVDWFSMLDKLYLKILPRSLRSMARGLGALHYALDRAIPMATSLALSLSGSIVTQVEKVSGAGGLQIGHLPVGDLMSQDPGRLPARVAAAPG